jgi:hypothetical protein
MASKFSPDHLVFFKINNVNYVLHKDITKRMGIFNVITDCQTSEKLELVMDLEIKYIDMIFEIVSDNIEKIQFKLDKAIDIIICMKYLSTDIKYIDIFCETMINYLNGASKYDPLAVQLFELFKNKPYREEMKYIFYMALRNNMFLCPEIGPGVDWNNIPSCIQLIKNDNNFLFDFKHDIIKLLVSQHIGVLLDGTYPDYDNIFPVAINKNDILNDSVLGKTRICHSSSHHGLDLNRLKFYYVRKNDKMGNLEFFFDDDFNCYLNIDDKKILLEKKDVIVFNDNLKQLKIHENEKILKNMTIKNNDRIVNNNNSIVQKNQDILIYISIFHVYASFIASNIMNN